MKQYLVFIGIAVVVSVAIVGLSYPTEIKVIDRVVEKLGAVPGNVIQSNEYTIGDVQMFQIKKDLAATSSVACSIKNPFNATTTIERFTTEITSSDLKATALITLSTSTTNVGSSTPNLVYNWSLGANQHGYLYWDGTVASSSDTVNGKDSLFSLQSLDTTYLTGASPFVLGPSEFLNLRIATVTPGTFSTYLRGTCTATLRDF